MFETNYETILLTEIQRRGTVTSLFDLAVRDLGLEYTWAWRCLRRLHDIGEVGIRRQQNARGRPLIITARRVS
jgi:molybdenum-dependent DNA-binding transcriptional regulator ModE